VKQYYCDTISLLLFSARSTLGIVPSFLQGGLIEKNPSTGKSTVCSSYSICKYVVHPYLLFLYTFFAAFSQSCLLILQKQRLLSMLRYQNLQLLQFSTLWMWRGWMVQCLTQFLWRESTALTLSPVLLYQYQMIASTSR